MRSLSVAANEREVNDSGEPKNPASVAEIIKISKVISDEVLMSEMSDAVF